MVPSRGVFWWVILVGSSDGLLLWFLLVGSSSGFSGGVLIWFLLLSLLVVCSYGFFYWVCQKAWWGYSGKMVGFSWGGSSVFGWVKRGGGAGGGL